ncbi:RNA polymerase subunit sigma-70 [Vibrio albus]|uniref:RNA polymerase subunit sigma-70 n=1 Tax=Vibrio albus TaxID=2200953 RepID=A0A2U3B781_9VIBR|nr:sigma-70 family RNA polymerase sigma factor [Vibrio albus]PWI32584.1 RNA polymerase subunit sigma-70 [Vibrio albus]
MSHLHSSSVAPCLLETWHLTESQLFYWLLKQCGEETLAFDLLQETFLRALQKQKGFCDIQNQRAWLFRVAANLLTDERRQSHKLDYNYNFEVCDDNSEEPPVVDSLAQCLPKALKRLPPNDKAIIESCDLNGMSQKDFAQHAGLTLPAAKSRLQRARTKLRETLKSQCQIHLDEQQRVCCFVPNKEK